MKRLLFLFILFFLVQPARADLVVSISQQGNNVVVNSNGSIDTSSFVFVESAKNGGSMQPSGDSFIGAGIVVGEPFDFNTSGNLDGYVATGPGAMDGPIAFGNGQWQAPDTGLGTLHGFNVFNPTIASPSIVWLPTDYQSGDFLSSEMVFVNKTISDLGLNVGTYNWDFNNNGIQLTIGVPEPATIPLVVASLLSCCILRRR